VDVTIAEDGLVTVKGPKGELSQKISEKIGVKLEDGVITVTRGDDLKESRSLHGLSRTLIGNMVTGVSTGFERKLEIQGVGYKVEKQGKNLILYLGYSMAKDGRPQHILEDPEGIETEVPSATEIIVRGIDKAVVGNYAAIIRAHRPPEPYKGKGIRYSGEKVRRKEGKAGVKG
jgi:large subunit ribosomal protein L6